MPTLNKQDFTGKQGRVFVVAGWVCWLIVVFVGLGFFEAWGRE